MPPPKKIFSPIMLIFAMEVPLGDIQLRQIFLLSDPYFGFYRGSKFVFWGGFGGTFNLWKVIS